MHAPRTGRSLLRVGAVSALLTLSLLVPVVEPASAPVAHAAGGTSETGATTYTVDPARRLVHARVDLSIRNTTPNRVSGYVVTRYFFNQGAVSVPSEATNIRVTRGGARLPVTIKRQRGFYPLVEFPLRPSIFYGQTATVRIDYDLPDGGARSASPIRVGSAFATFYAIASGGDRATVRIVFPAGYEVSTRGDEVTTSRGPSGTVLSTSGSVDAARWFVVVTADRPAGLRLEKLSLPIAGQERVVEVRAWPEDKTWATTVSDELRRGLPELGELIGLDWPISGPLEVLETYTPSLGGYAGFYTQGQAGKLDEIRVTEEPDPLVILHEASHAWFNYDLLQGRWINEGLADEFAARALFAIDGETHAPDAVDRTAAAAFPLNVWPEPGRIDDEEASAREVYGYDASWTVIARVIAGIGMDRMRDVLAAADAGEVAYVGRPAPERRAPLATWTDWRYFLDLLEQRGGSRQAAALFATWVVADGDRATLTAHEDAVADYAALVVRGAGWLPGYAIRSRMEQWAFTLAEVGIADAGAVLDRRARIEPLQAELGVEDGRRLEDSYEAATTSYEPTLALADDELTTLGRLHDATVAVAAERPPLVAVGLLGEDPTIDITEGAAAYGRGDLAGARTEAGQAISLIDGADEVGAQRVALGGAGAIVVVGGAGLLVVVRRRRRRAAPAEPPATLADQPAGEDQGEERS